MIPLSDPGTITRSRPYVNIALISISALVFLYELTLGTFDTTVFFYRWGLIPAELTGGPEFGQTLLGIGGTVRVVDLGSPWPPWGTVFSAMFVHGGIMHFGGNMLFLWVFGDNIEDRIGHLKYLVFYLACGVAATWTHVAFNMDSDVPAVGASGAIAGVMGAYILLYPYNRINTLVIFYFITVVRLTALYLLGFWFLLQFFGGVGSLGLQGAGVAYWAHVGGFVAGVLATALYLRIMGQPVWPRYRNMPWRWYRG